MEELCEVLRVLAPLAGGVPEGRDAEPGYWALVRRGAGGPPAAEWTPLGEGPGGAAAYDQAALQAEAQRGERLPIFGSRNLGELRPWPGLLYPRLARHSVQFLYLAARVHEEAGGGAVPAPPERLGEAARRLLGGAGGGMERSPRYRRLLEEIAAGGGSAERGLPWGARSVYRRSGRRTRLVGGVAELGREEEGYPVVDFQDVFVALSGLMDFMRCPEPPMILNRCGRNCMHREYPHTLVGSWGELELEVQWRLELRLRRDAHAEVGEQVAAVRAALLEHRILRSPAEFREIRETTLYFESRLAVSAHTVYLTAMLRPRTLMHRFYMNEVGLTPAVERQNDVLYYRRRIPGTEETFLTHVKIEAFHPKTEGWAAHHPFGERLQTPTLYTASIECTLPEQVELFERDLEELLGVMALPREAELVAHAARFFRAPPTAETVVPPAMEKSTRLYTVKYSPDRTAPDSNRAVYVPPAYAGDPALALGLARLISRSFQKGEPGHVYVSAGFRLHTHADWQRSGLPMDPFSALYVSATAGAPEVRNKLQDGRSMLPFVMRKAPAQGGARGVALQGITPTGSWVTAPLYNPGKERGFFGILRATLRDPAERAIPDGEFFGRAAGGVEGCAALCAPELYDHTPEEAAATLEAPDSQLHYRLAEHALGAAVLVFTRAEDPYERLEGPEPCRVEIEIPRHAGNQLRDFDAHERAVVLLRYYNEGWQYAVVRHSPAELILPATGGQGVAPGVPDLPADTVGREVLQDILGRHYYPRISLLHYATRSEAPRVLDRSHRLLTAAGAELVAQSLNPDGYSAALVLRGTPAQLAGGLCAAAGFPPPPPGALDPAGAAPLRLSVALRTPAIPLPLPCTEAHHGAPPALLEALAPGARALRNADGLRLLAFGDYVLTPELPPPAGGELLECQQAVAVLLSLGTHALTRCFRYVDEAGIGAAVERLARLVPTDPRAGPPEVRVPHRFAPPVPRPELGMAEALGRMAAEYLGGALPADPRFYGALREYFLAEWRWLRRHAPPGGDLPPELLLRHIGGVHAMVPAEGVYPPLALRQRFPPARWGRDSIVQSWKQYAYAWTRRAARDALRPWLSIPDLSAARAAKELDDHPAFAYRLRGGAVMYAFSADGHAAASDVLRAIAAQRLGIQDYQPMTVPGFKALEGSEFREDALLVFNTSSAITQGTTYRAEVFVPRPPPK